MRTVAAVILAASTLTGCQFSISRSSLGSGCAQWEPGPGQGFIVTLTEYEIRGIPPTMAGSEAGFCVQNEGSVLHEVRVSPLPKGVTLEEAIRPDISPEDLPLAFIGHSAEPGQITTFGIALERGLYAYACFQPAPNGRRTHASLGMRGGFEVQ